MISAHWVGIAVLMVVCAGAVYWVHRPLSGEQPQGDDLVALARAMRRDARTMGRRLLQALGALLVGAAVAGAIAGILHRITLSA